MKYQGLFEEDFRITQHAHAGHMCIDISTPYGRSILAPFRNDGIKCDWSSVKAGVTWSNGAIYDQIHDDMDNKDLLTFHESKTLVSKGQKIKERQAYAVTGNSGPSDPPGSSHTELHLRINGKEVDPEPYLDTYQKDGWTWIRGVKLSPQPPIETCEQKLAVLTKKLEEETLKNKDLEIAITEMVLIGTNALNKINQK